MGDELYAVATDVGLEDGGGKLEAGGLFAAVD